jgi:hypothetical protein
MATLLRHLSPPSQDRGNGDENKAEQSDGDTYSCESSGWQAVMGALVVIITGEELRR